MPIPVIIVGSSLVVIAMTSLTKRKKANRKMPQPSAETTGNKLIPLVEQHQHEVQQRKQEADTDFKFALGALSATGLAQLLYPPLLVATVPLTLFSSAPIFNDAWDHWKKKRKLHSGVIDCIAIVGTVGTGYYFAAALINSMYFLGQKILLKTEDHSSQKLSTLFQQTPRQVWLFNNGVEVETPFEAIEVGQIIVIHAGETIPFDGHIIEGTATVDQHSLTGESSPQEKKIGSTVFASTLLITGKLHICVDKAGKDTVAAQISEVLQNTLDFKATVEARSARVANQMTLPTLALSGVALGTIGPVGASAVANCNFSDIIRITIPLSVLNHLKLAAQQGILIKDGRALELLGEVDTVIFDKTGTLTEEVPKVGQIYTCNGFNEAQVLTLAASAEHRQTHPIAKAIIEAARQKGLTSTTANIIHCDIGYGIRVQIQEQTILLGSLRYMQKEGINIPPDGDWQGAEGAYSLLYLAVDNRLAGVIELHAQIRSEVPKIIKKLKQRGLKLCILSGDHEQPTQQLAKALGIQEYIAETLPEDKARHIEQLQAKGRKICFIGDGINDAIAMKKAQVAISLAGATTVATDTASIILLDKSLRQLDSLFTLAKGFDRNMKSGLAWSLLPGIAGIGAVFSLHMRIYGAVALYVVSLGAGATNAALPLLSPPKTPSSGP